ncbi:MAG TPA: DinB family protein [Bacteroidia bacterium]|jgi:hypothetical protein|nr:DinB family protein [Bacteroidia bacterium]
MEIQKQTLVKSVLDSWNARIKEANNILDNLTDEQLQKEIAPGKNRGTYLLGHLTAVNDKMLPLLNFGPQQFSNLDDTFLSKPDKAVAEMPTAKELRAYWKSSNEKLSKHFDALKPDEWFEKHSAVSAEDFAKEPHRNRLNIVLGRTSHLSYHLGQLALLKTK